MDWLRRIGRDTPAPVPKPEERAQAPTERASPGLAAFFDAVVEDRSHAVLDLGPAADVSLELYSRYARWVRFADLGRAALNPTAWVEALQEIPPNPGRPYDLVFAWDTFDRIEPDQRSTLIERLVEVTAPDARLFLTATSSNRSGPVIPLRFGVLETDRMRFLPTGDPYPVRSPLLPAEVERLLEPFRVVRAFTSKVGFREYVAARRKG